MTILKKQNIETPKLFWRSRAISFNLFEKKFVLSAEVAENPFDLQQNCRKPFCLPGFHAEFHWGAFSLPQRNPLAGGEKLVIFCQERFSASALPALLVLAQTFLNAILCCFRFLPVFGLFCSGLANILTETRCLC